MANNVKGTRDVLTNEASLFSLVEHRLKTIAHLFSYNEIRTPILEYSEVFSRGVGESSDVVRKEMYTFLDKASRSVTMRPEFTAGIIRSVIQNKLYATEELPIKLFYLGPAFRYERPQLGRYRQFNQFGVESVGNPSLYNDVEVISMAYNMLLCLGLEGATLKINCLGDNESRNAYREALKAYFLPHLDKMCEDCKQRYEINPLRILDCKVPEDKLLAASAPKIRDYLSKNSLDRFNKIKSLLEELHIPYEIDDQLVRGLDYYSEIVFEFAYTSKKGVDYGALGGGGHYSNLVKELGGPDLPGVGFSFGIERLIDIMKDDEILKAKTPDVDIYLMPLGEEARGYALRLALLLRMSGYRSDMCFDEVKLANMFKRAERKGTKFAIIIGENEIANHRVNVKCLATGEQEEVNENNLIDYLNNKTSSHCCHHHDDNHECKCGNHDEDHECCCDDECCCNNK